jgi:predicted ester cyclase
MAIDNKALARRWFDEVWNNRRKEVIYELSDPNVVTYGLAEGQKASDIPEFLPFYDRFIATFPDIHITVEDVIAEGDKTAVRLSAKGTHTGDAMGIAPTGRPVTLTALILIRWKNGKIVEAWNEFDAWGMMQQMAGPAPMKVKE